MSVECLSGTVINQAGSHALAYSYFLIQVPASITLAHMFVYVWMDGRERTVIPIYPSVQVTRVLTTPHVSRVLMGKLVHMFGFNFEQLPSSGCKTLQSHVNFRSDSFCQECIVVVKVFLCKLQ